MYYQDELESWYGQQQGLEPPRRPYSSTPKQSHNGATHGTTGKFKDIKQQYENLSGRYNDAKDYSERRQTYDTLKKAYEQLQDSAEYRGLQQQYTEVKALYDDLKLKYDKLLAAPPPTKHDAQHQNNSKRQRSKTATKPSKKHNGRQPSHAYHGDDTSCVADFKPLHNRKLYKNVCMKEIGRNLVAGTPRRPEKFM
jgi:hypothetical protein